MYGLKVEELTLVISFWKRPKIQTSLGTKLNGNEIGVKRICVERGGVPDGNQIV